MRRYDDPVDVRKAMVNGPSGRTEGPEQFLWRGRLWKVRDVVAHWVETGPWWQSNGVHAVLSVLDSDDPADPEAVGDEGAVSDLADLSGEREVWRVEAARGPLSAGLGHGVFDLAFDWADGSWKLARCVD